MKKNFGFIHNDPDTINTLDATKVPKKAVQGTPWYQILSNQMYINNFYYVGAFVGEREKIIEDGFGETKNNSHSEWEKRIRCEQSDIIMVLLNLAFIPDEIVENQDILDDFKSGWCHRLQEAMAQHKEKFNEKVKSKQEIQYYLSRPANEEKLDKATRLFLTENDKSKEESPYANFEEVVGGQDTCVYDTEWKYQDASLEKRYADFKAKRDKWLLEDVPDTKKKNIE
jgi:hypothetical protein